MLLVPIILASCLLFAYIFKSKRNDETAPSFLRNFSRDEYEIIKVLASSAEQDASVEFVVKFNGELKMPDNFQEAEESDLQDFKSRMIKHDLLNEADTNSARMLLYRGDVILGPRTICAEFPCSAYVMNAKGDDRFYMGIYKN